MKNQALPYPGKNMTTLSFDYELLALENMPTRDEQFEQLKYRITRIFAGENPL